MRVMKPDEGSDLSPEGHRAGEGCACFKCRWARFYAWRVENAKKLEERDG